MTGAYKHIPEPKRILVIDDEQAVRHVLRDLLASEGYLVIEAADGAQGLNCLRATCPDVVILDLMMPRMNGWAFAEECRRMDSCGELPIIAMSAVYDVEGAAAALRALNVRACLAKPFDLDVLLEQVALLA